MDEVQFGGIFQMWSISVSLEPAGILHKGIPNEPLEQGWCKQIFCLKCKSEHEKL